MLSSLIRVSPGAVDMLGSLFREPGSQGAREPGARSQGAGSQGAGSVGSHLAPRLPGSPTPYLIRTRSTSSHRDMSDRITTSPAARPSLISTLLTDIRPSRTETRWAYRPPSTSLKIPM